MDFRPISIDKFPVLKEYVYDVYELRNDDDEFVYTTIPNGIIGISIALEGESFRYNNRNWHRDAPVDIFGMIQQPRPIRISPNFREIAIGFKPYVLRSLIDEQMFTLSNGQNASCYDLFDHSLLNRLVEKLFHATSDQLLASAINDFIAELLKYSVIEKRIAHAVQKISLYNQISVKEVAEEVNLSTTSLRNHFKNHIGISPKELIRLYRVKSALNVLSLGKDDTSLTKLAYDLGYYDQAHFIHHFKDSIGLSPKEYIENGRLAFDFYNYKRWKGDSFGILSKIA